MIIPSVGYADGVDAYYDENYFVIQDYNDCHQLFYQTVVQHVLVLLQQVYRHELHKNALGHFQL